MGKGFVCGICGYLRQGSATTCPHCSENVCEKCWTSQGKGKGHEMAEHRHEIAQKEGRYSRGDD